MTLLRRLGNKQAIAHKIIPFFPPHDIYVEPFFAAGGLFFNKPRARHNFLNDNDSEVFNLYMVCLNDRERLKFELARMPVHQSLWEHWKKEIPADPVLKAVRFLFYSNFGYMGMKASLCMIDRDPKAATLEELERLDFGEVKFGCSDFEPFLKSICIDSPEKAWDSVFCYADPPYLEDGDNRAYTPFTEADTNRLFDVLDWRGCKYAVSEFDNPVVIQMAENRGLQTHVIGERKNMKNRRTEILITNYDPPRQLRLF
jgi:DNA adenine methylase